MITIDHNFKTNDVYSFRYNAEEYKKRFEPYHCFDGQLIVKQKSDGSLYLEDTYWSSGNKWFTIEKALLEGTLEFKCNLDNVEVINKHDTIYYDNSDIFDISHQHHCYEQYVIKKGAKRSKEKMLLVINEKIAELNRKIEYCKEDLLRQEINISEIEKGNLNIYI